MPKLGLLGTFEQFLDKEGDGKIHLTSVAKATKKCEFHYNEGYARNNAEIEYMPNNKDGSVTLKFGMPVVVKWKGSYQMWSAKIVAINSDGTFSLHYDDGDKDRMLWFA